MIISPEIQGALMVIIVIYFAVSGGLSASDPDTDTYPERVTVAELGDDEGWLPHGIQGIEAVVALNVVIVTDTAAGVDLVRLTFQSDKSSENGLITVAQARELAEWLRIAASPGKTLAEAKFNHRHGGHLGATSGLKPSA